ncbi:hypothetical protein PP744_gp050 [Rhizobium phage RHph_N38]|uniref:Uncharacterized protein n=1 Tax=Rhizobium phage RHph_N38 TaxID=2509750 RepID=A0A7S5R3F9_9CAUD|nr:hypothetical protein PP744_gp050 [Rhizobium phage RHph_N38]QIG70513.1 hypothetical protein EVB89_050 [Rhizobium phage RHph_N38]
MYLGGKTRNKRDSLPKNIRKENGRRHKVFILEQRELGEKFEVPMKELIDTTPNEGDLLFSGAFGQKLRFDY